LDFFSIVSQSLVDYESGDSDGDNNLDEEIDEDAPAQKRARLE
jgi:hypothetical protein